MKLLGPMQHRLLDYVTVLVFALAPIVLSLEGIAAMLAWMLAVVHLAMTLLTRFRPQGGGLVPLALHGWVELAVGAALLVLGVLAPWSAAARVFYGIMGAVILAIRATTAYGPVGTAGRQEAEVG